MRLATIVFLLALLHGPAIAQDGAFGSGPADGGKTPPAAPPSKNDPVVPESGAPATPTTATPSAPTTPATGAGAGATGAALPSAAEIFKRGLEAIGGEEAVRRHTCMRIEGTLSAAAMGMTSTMVVQARAPNLFLTTIDMAGVGSMRQGFDGTTAWMTNPMSGTQLLEGRTLAELRRSADFYRELDPGKVWKTATVKGVVEFAGRPCHEIAVEGDVGNGSLFYGVDDGLARGMRMEVEAPMGMGKVPTITRMLEYKPFDGLLIAVRTEVEAMGLVQTMTVDKVLFDPIDPKVFELPADVKALVAAGKTSAPPAKRPARVGGAVKATPNAKPAPAPSSTPAAAPTP